MEILNKSEYDFLKNKLNRLPNELEQNIVNAQWSEHCSYKSSKIHLRTLPTEGKRLVKGAGFDAGVIDVGNGYVVTVHIESHNHPSAVDPYGGSATGVGGVLRDILSNGTRPIAVLNALRFGEIHDKKKSNNLKNQWLLKNVVKGIADYGNCMGIPTIGGEIEFDSSFDNYCLVDVASLGFGKKTSLVKNKVRKSDLIILAGNSTGKDGIHGASFASSNLEEENRSAIQIPDPFLEKLLLEATIEAVDKKCIKAMKDLGGGGLACCLSETADNLNIGIEVDLSNVHLKHKDLNDIEIMISESQERMLYITSKEKMKTLIRIFKKHNLKYSIIGKVTNSHNLSVKKNRMFVADMPAKVVANAPLLDRPSKRPEYIDNIYKNFNEPPIPKDLEETIVSMISNPSICDKKWVYEQFDHEVGIRTVLKPGLSDSSLLKLDNGVFISCTLDGNSKHCYLDPYNGTLGILSEAVRNTMCVGATPIGIVDHLQFGNPENEQIFWTFLESIRAIKDFCKIMKIPVVGGKVSLYNETKNGPIKPSPVIGTLGIINNIKSIKTINAKENDCIFIIGLTAEEMGGSEYYEYYCKITGGKVPTVNLKEQMKIIKAIKLILNENLTSGIHDCSKGGFMIALMELAIQCKLGFTIDIGKVPTKCKRIDYILFSESHNRFILFTQNPLKIKSILNEHNIPFANIGKTKRNNDCTIKLPDKQILNLSLSEITYKYNNSLADYLQKNKKIV